MVHPPPSKFYEVDIRTFGTELIASIISAPKDNKHRTLTDASDTNYSTCATTTAMKILASVHVVALLVNPSKTTSVAAFQIAHRAILSPQSIRRAPPTTLFSTKSDELSWQSREKCWRPTIQDVERISFGKPAKKKGTGSRGVPHRLNEDERKMFDQARRKGFLEVGGSGWRSQRRDAPLVNTYRSLCDARGQAFIALHKGNTGLDELVVDLSPLRLPDTFEVLEKEMIDFVGIPTSYRDSEENTQDLLDESEVEIVGSIDPDDDPYDNRPIYQLPTYCISWEIQRSEGKALGKKLAQQFKTIEANASKSMKPKHVKPGKNRRSGGYGIG